MVGDNPEIEYCLTDIDGAGSCSSYTVEIEWSHIRSPEYRLVRDRFLVREEILQKELSDQKVTAAKLEKEISEMKSSRLWKIGERYRSFRNRD